MNNPIVIINDKIISTTFSVSINNACNLVLHIYFYSNNDIIVESRITNCAV